MTATASCFLPGRERRCAPIRPAVGSKRNELRTRDRQIGRLTARHCERLTTCTPRQSKTSNYLISLDEEDTSRNSGNYFGKLRSNFVGTEFTIYDKGSKPGRGDSTVRVEFALPVTRRVRFLSETRWCIGSWMVHDFSSSVRLASARCQRDVSSGLSCTSTMSWEYEVPGR